MRRLNGHVQHFAWGSRTELPDLLRREPDGRPWAEYWLGTHPSGPATLTDGSTLELFVREHPEVLGAATESAYGAQLPFLLKFLSAGSPLSLQAHPSREQAEAGYARESLLGLAPDAPVLLWVGFPAAFKHIELLLAAYRQVRAARPAARLVLAGDFQTRPDFVRQAGAEGVIFAGRVDHSDLPAYYQLASIYVHSSRYEGVARVLMEALAAGTPVVATDHLGAAEVVRHGESGLLTAHTPEALAEAIITLLDDPARAQAMGAAGQRDALERFDYERGLDAIAETYRATLRLAGRA